MIDRLIATKMLSTVGNGTKYCEPHTGTDD